VLGDTLTLALSLFEGEGTDRGGRGGWVKPWDAAIARRAHSHRRRFPLPTAILFPLTRWERGRG